MFIPGPGRGPWANPGQTVRTPRGRSRGRAGARGECDRSRQEVMLSERMEWSPGHPGGTWEGWGPGQSWSGQLYLLGNF